MLKIRDLGTRGWLRRSAVLGLVAGSTALASGCAISQQQELEMGAQYAAQINQQLPIVNDATLNRYINVLGRQLAARGGRGLQYQFFIVNSNVVNAFAVPGGYVYINRGIVERADNVSELAGVLAHEIGHVIEKHHLKILQQARLVDLGGKVLTSKVGENEQIKALIGNGAEMFARALDRNAETDADRIAVVLAARAGYDPFGLPTVLQDLGRVARDDSRVALLFKTHPHPDDRLAALGDAIGSRLDGTKGQMLANRFYRVKQ